MRAADVLVIVLICGVIYVALYATNKIKKNK